MIFLDRETQIRATVSEEMILRYYEIMEDEEGLKKFPPVILYRDEKGHIWVADGHHRIMAAVRRKFQSIHAIIRQGEKADAIWAAVLANGRNGIALGRSDIRRAVIMVISAYPDRSDQVIADAVGCSHMTVRRIRSSEPNLTDVKIETRIGKDGKRRPVRQSKKSVAIHKKPASESDSTGPQSGKPLPQSEKPTSQPDEPEALPEKAEQQFGLHCRPGEKPGATGEPFIPTTTLKDLRHDNPDILMSQLMAHFPREYCVGLIKSVFRGLFNRDGEEITKPLLQELYQEYGG